MEIYGFVAVTSTFSRPILFSFTGFVYVWVTFGAFQRFWKNKKFKMADPRWSPFENMTNFE